MRVGLIDVDGHNYPNLPLMKLSAWHKSKGDSVEWYQPLFSGHMDIVYMSKVFSFTPDYEYYIDAEKVVRGGHRLRYISCRWQGNLRQVKGHTACRRDRAYIPGLQPIPRTDERHRLRIPYKRMPERL